MTSRESRGRRPSAIVWIDERHAVVASTLDEDRVTTAEIERGTKAEGQFLANVVHEIIDRERVMIIGSPSARLALEREYVAVSHRPERLVAVPLAASVTGGAIVDRLRHLAA